MIPPGMQKALKRIQEMAEIEDPFCCGHEAVDFLYNVLSELGGK